MENTTFENTPGQEPGQGPGQKPSQMPRHYHDEPSFYEKNKTLIKGFLVGFLVLLMLIPQSFISNLIADRQEHHPQIAETYLKIERSVKYALLFIALNFAVFFFIEITQKKQMHPVQYLLVGFALTIFYSLLLSISEYTGFNPAYIIAATATVSLIGLYVHSVFNQGRLALYFSAALGALYGYIFILIQMQDYALLFGSIGLFIILAMLMYFSRKIDWYGLKTSALATS